MLGDGRVRVSREKQGRGGKTVTVVRGLALDADALAALGKQLRAACGTGGTAKDGVLELQGDHVERVLALLQQQGHPARRSGGLESGRQKPPRLLACGLNARLPRAPSTRELQLVRPLPPASLPEGGSSQFDGCLGATHQPARAEHARGTRRPAP